MCDSIVRLEPSQSVVVGKDKVAVLNHASNAKKKKEMKWTRWKRKRSQTWVSQLKRTPSRAKKLLRCENASRQGSDVRVGHDDLWCEINSQDL